MNKRARKHQPTQQLEYYDILMAGPPVFFTRAMEFFVSSLVTSGKDVEYYSCIPFQDGVDDFARASRATSIKEMIKYLPLAGIKYLEKREVLHEKEKQDSFYEFRNVCPHPVYIASLQMLQAEYGMMTSVGLSVICAKDRSEADQFIAALGKFKRTSSSSKVISSSGVPILNFRTMRWEDIILPKEVMSEIRRDVTQFFEQEKLYAENSLDWKMGILLAGSAGNGKTSLCRAIATTSSVPVVYCSFEDNDVFHMLSEAKNTVAACAPCILVIEDVDSFGTEDSVRSNFLNLLDGMCGTKGILTLATTNDPDKLDSAFTGRPSRFDSFYVIGDPEPAERMAILRLRLGKNCKFFSEEDLSKAVKEMDSLSAAAVQEVAVNVMRMAFHAKKRPDKKMLSHSVQKVRKHMTCSSQGMNKWIRGSVGFRGATDPDDNL